MNYHTRQSKDLEESNRYAGHCTTKTKKVDSKQAFGEKKLIAKKTIEHADHCITRTNEADKELTSQGSQPYQRPGLKIIQVSKGYPAVSVIKSTLGILNRNRTKAKETDPKGIRL
ncbi:hypothetical protein NC651_032393 [Populus alba x Populus x berolinensis]|nr:hypothetical protein NC651_032393 [Populus alba x Populus x berolinensis]